MEEEGPTKKIEIVTELNFHHYLVEFVVARLTHEYLFFEYNFAG